ncbi:MAG: diacylglycerol kinase [Parcubacteria group bacterium LiPW_41]|nr:MAG: diacylglycerol kinase [Parcubacteria group bacterium LiPW_41]
MRQFIESFSHAFDGLCFVWKEEKNFRIQVIIGILVIVVMGIFGFSYLEMSMFIVAITLVLTAETINTTFEDTLNKIQPEHDPVVGKIKDISAGIVVLCVLGAICIGILIFLSHFSF